MKGAVQRWLVANVAGAVLVVATGGAWAVDVTDADRVFVNYTRETATVGQNQFRLEVRGLVQEDERTNPDLNVVGLRLRSIYPDQQATKANGGHVDLVASYGFGKNAELGFVIPGVIQSVHFKDAATRNDADIGDVVLYTKFKRSVAEHCAVGAGVELITPSAPTSKGFGTGELGVNPILSTRYQQGRVAVGANVGYQFSTGAVKDVLNYGGEVILRGSETYALRTEIAGRSFDDGGKSFVDMTILPGVEINVANNVAIRPTGLVGVTSSAPQWGLGVGVAVTL
ncbi:MAG: hypothetical protein ACHQ9S_08905 [Candidatus Binatia bacterium]